jgi:two-component system chemotaxis sensor kinase CheA
VDDLIPEFLTETNESLAELDISLVQLEQNPGDKDLLSQIFRVMHTIKGTSGFLNLPRLGSVAHKAEDLLGLFRDDKLQPTPGNISLIFEALDRIKMVLASLESTGKEPEGEDGDLISRLAAACHGEEAAPPAPAAATHDAMPEIEIPEAAVMNEPVPVTVPETPPSQAPATTNNAPAAAAGGEPSAAAQSLRVSVDVLEGLMTLVSELVLTRNQILQISRLQKDNELSGSLQRLNHIVSDLQEGVMKTRMQPVGNAWSKLPRIIRDISNDLGKKIELEMLGQDTELDRQVLEMIKDPLTHMVRNSADHGIEKPADRIAAGKPETGYIRLNSYHEGGHILIEISDDGQGLPLEKIKKKILQNNLATEAELAAMPPQKIQQYIFAAGFSTAEKITSVSGRGVGMDVVRTNIEKIGGSIEMNSVEGQGTTFTIKIPLTLAIVSSLIVGIEDERFAIPQLDVTELVRATETGANRIEMVNETPILRLRGRILPLICLRTLLGFPPRKTEKPRYIAVIRVGSYSFGIIVEQVFDTEEIVVKPVTSLLGDQAIFSGNTILGDGQVIVILDSAGLLKASGVVDKAALGRDRKSEAVVEGGNKDEVPLLLFNAIDNNLKAVPLQHVARLEEINLADIEFAGGQRVVQYGDALMPIHLYDPRADLPTTGRRPVIVFKTKDGLSGLVVDRILDITTHKGEYQIKSEGTLEGSAIVQGKTTDIINLSFEGWKNARSGFVPQPDLAAQPDYRVIQ